MSQKTAWDRIIDGELILAQSSVSTKLKTGDQVHIPAIEAEAILTWEELRQSEFWTKRLEEVDDVR